MTRRHNHACQAACPVKKAPTGTRYLYALGCAEASPFLPSVRRRLLVRCSKPTTDVLLQSARADCVSSVRLLLDFSHDSVPVVVLVCQHKKYVENYV
jgi:hypothetical protein